MKQKTYTTIGALIVAANKVASGANEYAATLGLVSTTKAVIDADVAALILARDNHEASKSELTTRRSARDESRDAAFEWTVGARDVLKRKLGNEASIEWEGTGLRYSLLVPRSPDRLLAVMQSMKSYFESHATLEVAPLEITAAKAGTLITELTGAINAVNTQVTAVKTLAAVRDTKRNALQGRISIAVVELSRVLTPLDPRWLSFGFNLPGASEIPPVPQGLIAVLIGPNAVSLKWDASARAEYYRVWKKVVGTDAEFIAVGKPADIDFTLEGLPANATIEIMVSAVNNGGESLKSEVVTVTTA